MRVATPIAIAVRAGLAARLLTAAAAMALVHGPGERHLIGATHDAGGEPPAQAQVFTADQAAAGEMNYETYCIACHQADLGGQNEALPLKGPHFFESWGSRTTRDLFSFISSSMPPGQANLSEREYVELVAFLLRSNGAAAGTHALTATTTVEIARVVPKP